MATAYAQRELNKWVNATYPYDGADCHLCATLHAAYDGCDNPAHAVMTAEAKQLGFSISTQQHITSTVRRRILAFRRKFARFYPRRAEGAK